MAQDGRYKHLAHWARWLAIALWLTACGGGGSSLPPERPANTVQGVAMAGPIIGGQVVLYDYQGGRKGEVLGTGTTDADGRYAVSIRAPAQPVLIELSGGAYQEEASGLDVTLAEGQVLQAVVMQQPGQPITANITPLTHIIAGLTAYKVQHGAAVDVALRAAGAEVADTFGLDVPATTPRVVTDARNATTTLSQEHLYGFYLAALSSWSQWLATHTNAAAPAAYSSVALSQILYSDVNADGVLDGRGYNKDSTELMDLAYGTELLDADVYRLALAQHLIAAANSAQNQTDLGVDKLVPAAQGLYSRNPSLFAGAVRSGNSASAAPRIVGLEAEGFYHRGVFTYPIVIASPAGARQVTFELDGASLGEAADPANPAVVIDSRGYSDGSHVLRVTATDALGNESFQEFTLLTDNTAPFINLSAASITNQARYLLRGTYEDNGAGVQRITVQGVAASLAGGQTWSADVNLEPGLNMVPVVITDYAQNEHRYDVQVTLDQTAPLIHSGTHSQATFTPGSGGRYVDVLQDQNNNPLWLTTDRVELKGVPIRRADLDANGIPYFALSVADPGAATSAAGLGVRMQVERNGAVLAPWRALSPADIAGDEPLYLIPLATETLHPDWLNASPQDQYALRVEVTDQAGNNATTVFAFKAAFVVPDVVIDNVVDLNDTVISSMPFANRATLQGATFPTTAYTYTNTSGKAYYIRLRDDASHSAEQLVEQAVREHKIQLKTTTEWQLGLIGTPGQSLVDEGAGCNPPITWQTVSEVKNYNGSVWEAKAVPSPRTGSPLTHNADTLPAPPTPSAWQDAPDFDTELASFSPAGFSVTYRYDYIANTSFADGRPAYVAGWTRSGATPVTCPDIRNFQQREVYSYQSVTGYPQNMRTTLKSTSTFTTTAYEVYDQTTGAAIADVDGWYRIPAGGTITILKRVTTPRFPVYNDTDVADPDFASYSPHRLDKSYSWTVNRRLIITAVHDAGSAKINAMATHDNTVGTGSHRYQNGR